MEDKKAEWVATALVVVAIATLAYGVIFAAQQAWDLLK